MCVVEDAWDFLRCTRFGLAQFFNVNNLRRVADGAAAVLPTEYGELSRYGLFLLRQQIAVRTWDATGPEECLDKYHILFPILKSFVCTRKFYEQNGYRGNVQFDVSLKNVYARILPFLRDTDRWKWHLTPDTYRAVQAEVRAGQLVEAQRMRDDLEDVMVAVLHDLCWCFWQREDDSFPTDALRAAVKEFLDQHREYVR
jgi:hypothetical protein